MKEFDYTKWDNKPREMWVWNDDEDKKEKRFVLKIDIDDAFEPVLASNGIWYKHSAEIEQKAEAELWITEHSKPKYRPFKDCNELIETWCNLVQKKCDPYREEDYSKNTLSLPTIWVLDNKNGIAHSITDYDLKMNTPNCIKLNGNWKDLEFIFKYCSFLDGSACGVEE